MPIPHQKGKQAAIITCTTPLPFSFIAAESQGTIRAFHEVSCYDGYKIVNKILTYLQRNLLESLKNH